MLAWKVAPAIAAGNTVVIKPADLTPLTAYAFAEMLTEIGLPAGVVNIVNGDGETGAAIAGHADIDKVAFTGSTEVGRLIRRQIAGSGKKLSLELGGKSPFIVMEDADLDAAVEGVVDAIWFNQGEVCCAGSRILVQEGVAPAFFGKLKGRMTTMRSVIRSTKPWMSGRSSRRSSSRASEICWPRRGRRGDASYRTGGHAPDGLFLRSRLFHRDGACTYRLSGGDLWTGCDHGHVSNARRGRDAGQ